MGFKKIAIILIIFFAISAAVAYFIIVEKDLVEYITAEVARNDIKQTVRETGAIKASSDIDLAFLNSGKISKILVKIGESIKKDQILTELDYSGLSIKQQEAEANLDIAKAKLAKLLAGAAYEEIAVSQANVDKSKSLHDASIRELEKIKNTTAENINQAKKTLNDLELKTENDITPYEQAITVAQINLDNTKNTYQRAIDNKQEIVLTTIEDKLIIVNTTLDNINTIITDEDAKYLLSVKQASYLDDTKNNKSKAEKLLITANDNLLIAKQNKTAVNMDNVIDDALAAINMTFTVLSNCYNALENSITSSDFTQAELDAFKTTVSADLTSVSSAISSTQTARQNFADAILNYDTNTLSAEENLVKAKTDLNNAIITAKNALTSAQLSSEQQITSAQSKVGANLEAWKVAKAQLSQIKARARIQDIILQQAQIKQAKAALQSVKNQIENSVIKAPIDGIITKIEYEIGEQAQVSKPIISMLAKNTFEIEVLISESDIAKIKINNPAEITLDAFGEDIKFQGKVYFIEPAETVIQDVIYYKALIDFLNIYEHEDISVKPGMTANVVITTAQKENVLVMPSRAIIERNGDRIVRVLVQGEINETLIKIGLRGDEGMVEVLSGVKEGDEVVTFIKEKK